MRRRRRVLFAVLLSVAAVAAVAVVATAAQRRSKSAAAAEEALFGTGAARRAIAAAKAQAAADARQALRDMRAGRKPPRRAKRFFNASALWAADADDDGAAFDDVYGNTGDGGGFFEAGRALRARGEALGLTASAVLINFHRRENLPLLLRQLAASRLFDEAVLWNNDVETPLEGAPEAASPDPAVLAVRVVDGATNIGTLARYEACVHNTSRRNAVCFVVDDDWDPSSYLHSLYGAFLREPRLVHAATNAGVRFTHNSGMAYANASIGLHTRHTWLGCGAFFLRDYAERHLELAHRMLVPEIAPFTPLSAERNATKFAAEPIFHSDIAFNLFRNAEPVDVIVPFLTIAGTFRDPISNGAETSRYMFALSRNIADLIAASLASADQRERSVFATGMPDPAAETHAICQSRPFPWLPGVPCAFNARVSRFAVVESHDYGVVVDSDLKTWWTPGSAAVEGDWFGVDWFFAERPHSVTRVAFSHSLEAQLALAVDLTDDGIRWRPPRAAVRVTCQLLSVAPPVSACNYAPDEPHAGIRFRVPPDPANFEIRVHEIQARR